MASARARSAAPTVSAASATAMSSWTRCHRAAWLPAGPERDHRGVVEDEAGQLAGGVERGHELGSGRLEQVRAHPLLAARHHDGPVGGVPVDDGRLLAREHPLGALAARPRPHRVHGLAVPLLTEGHRAPAGAGGQVGQQLGRRRGRGRPGWRRPRRRRTAPARGCGPSARGRCTFRAGPSRCRPGPRAPAGPSIPARPASTTVAGVMPSGSSASWRTTSGVHSRSSAARARPAVRAARRRT